MKKPVIAVSLVSVAALALAGCSSAGSAGGTSPDDGRIAVVASTNVYGDLAAAVGGDRVDVTSIIRSATQDPHSYEASARDRLTVEGADLVIENGGGYDAFIDDLLDGSDVPVLTAVEFSHDYPGNAGHDEAEHSDHAGAEDDHAEHDHGDEHGEEGHAGHDHIEGFNEHVWFDPHTMRHLVEDIAAHLTELDPEGKADFEAGAATLTAELEDAETQLADLKEKAAGANVILTEPVPGYLAAAAGLTDVTPDGFAEAVEEGRDVPPATLLAALQAIEGGGVRAVLTNAQTGGPETQRVEDAATEADVPVVAFTEILPEGKTYAEWMHDAIASLATALGA